MALASTILGILLLVSAGLFILSGLVSVAQNWGYWALMEVLSPLNVWQWISMTLNLAPGAFFVWLGNRLKKRKRLTART